jgi:hypothetical protein
MGSWRALWRHERALLVLQGVMLCLLVARAGVGHRATGFVGLVLVAQAVTLAIVVPRASRWAQLVRLGSAYPVALALYSSFAIVTPALGFPLRDMGLLALDEALFGQTPALLTQPWVRPWLTEVLSACYFSYHLYLHGLLVVETLKPLPRAHALHEALFSAFAVGYAGYLFVPAMGPLSVMGSAFTVPLQGGWMTALNDAVVARAGAGYDVFPSLHVLITCVLLAHDARHARWRFFLMLPVCLGLFVSTVYLRYHYVVDLFAGLGVFLAIRWALGSRGLSRWERGDRHPHPVPLPEGEGS